MIELSREHARILLRVYEDIIDIDSRLGCTDEGFRWHYKLLLEKNPYVRDAVSALKASVGNAVEK